MTQSKCARDIQQSFYENLGDRSYDEYTDNKYLIKHKVAFSLFGQPDNNKTEEFDEELDFELANENSTYGYNAEQLKMVLPLYKKILQYTKYSGNKKSIYISVIFVCLVPIQQEFENNIRQAADGHFTGIQILPVFRIRKCVNINNKSGNKFGCSFFIDHIGRVYINWDAYLTNNKLGEGVIVAPKDGWYWGELVKNFATVKLDICLSPASTIGAKVKNTLDAASTGVSIGATMILLGSLFTPVGAVLGGIAAVATVTTGIYGVATSTRQLTDRSKHDEGIGLGNDGARGAWINIAASSTGIVAGASSKVIAGAAESGMVIGKSVQVLHNTVTITALMVAGTGIVNSLCDFIIRYDETKEFPNAMEIFQFASSVLFFTNALVSNKMASTIIKESQSSTINAYRDSLGSNRQRKAFDKVSAETRRLNGFNEGNAEIIRSSKVIGTQDSFYRDALKINKDLNRNNVRISLRDGGAVLNGDQPVNLREIRSMDSVQKSTYLTSVGNADLTVPNVPTRLTVHNVNFSGQPTTVIGTVVSSVISVGALLKSFPDILECDEIILQRVVKMLHKILNDDQYLYTLFVDVINKVKTHINEYFKEILAVLDIAESSLLYRVINACIDFFLDFCDENEIGEYLKMYFKDGYLNENKVKRIAGRFKRNLLSEYEKYKIHEVRCPECQGLTFHK